MAGAGFQPRPIRLPATSPCSLAFCGMLPLGDKLSDGNAPIQERLIGIPGIDHFDASTNKIFLIACYQGHIVFQANGRNH